MRALGSSMRFTHGDSEYSLPDECWEEAGMHTVVVGGQSYLAGPSPFPNLDVVDIAVDNIAPVHRSGSHGVFNDNPEYGTAHDRVLSILRGFRSGSRIPPIEVSRLPSPARQEFKLIHGVHRLYCSIAAGYSHIPAVRVIDFFGTYR
jgi:hypothetical protein